LNSRRLEVGRGLGGSGNLEIRVPKRSWDQSLREDGEVPEVSSIRDPGVVRELKHALSANALEGYQGHTSPVLGAPAPFTLKQLAFAHAHAQGDGVVGGGGAGELTQPDAARPDKQARPARRFKNAAVILSCQTGAEGEGGGAATGEVPLGRSIAKHNQPHRTMSLNNCGTLSQVGGGGDSNGEGHSFTRCMTHFHVNFKASE
jgi:hypothetical protein